MLQRFGAARPRSCVSSRNVPSPWLRQSTLLSPGGDEQVDAPVVVDVARADALAPVVVRDPAFCGDVLEPQAAEVVIEEVRRRRVRCGRTGPVDEEQVGKAVVVVVEDGDAGAGVLDDVHLLLVGAGDIDAR